MPLQYSETQCPTMPIRCRCMPAGQEEDFCEDVQSKRYQWLLTPEGYICQINIHVLPFSYTVPRS